MRLRGSEDVHELVTRELSEQIANVGFCAFGLQITPNEHIIDDHAGFLMVRRPIKREGAATEAVIAFLT